jgi:hypothetical protein
MTTSILESGTPVAQLHTAPAGDGDLRALAIAMADADDRGEAPAAPLMLSLGSHGTTASLTLQGGRILLELGDEDGRIAISRMAWPNARSLGLALLALGDAAGELPA